MVTSPGHIRWAIKPNWILKDDGDKVVLYLLSNYESTYFTLTRHAAIILSFFDGVRTVEDIIDATRFVFGCSPEAAQNYLNLLLQTLQDQVSYPILSHYPVFVASLNGEARTALDPLELATMTTIKPYTRGRRLNSPISLLLFFTNLCQTDCRYCYAERRPISKSDLLTLQEWRSILDQAKTLQIKKAELSGGDVFARREGIEFVELLLEYGMLFLLSTKCRVPPEYAKRLADAGFCNPVYGVLREIQFSIDSADPQVAGFLTRRPEFLTHAVASLHNLVNAGIYPKVKTVLTPYNIEGLELLVEELISIGIRVMHFTFYEPSFYRHTDDLLLSNNEKDRVADILSQFPQKYPAIQFEGNGLSKAQGNDQATKTTQWRSRAGCSGGRTGLGITADGKAIICEQTPQGSPFVFGDLRKSSIPDIWNSNELLDFVFPARENFVNTVCFDCSEFDHCHYELGHCFRDTFFATGNPFDAPPSCPYREETPRIGNWRSRS